jgi:hypothetical protein
MFCIWSTQWRDVSSKGPGHLNPYGLPECSLHGLFPGPMTFLGRCSMFLASPTSLGLYCSLGFTLTARCITLLEATYRYFDCCTLPGLSSFPLKTGWKPTLSYNLYFACLQSQHCMYHSKVDHELKQHSGLFGQL